jgi:HlyD family secretion protein
MFRKNKWIWIAAGIVVLLLLFVIIGKKNGWLGNAAALKVNAEKVQRRTITERVSASGKIYPEIEVKLSPDVSGEIILLNVEEGDSVRENDLLLKIKPDIYEAAYEQAVAALNTARAAQLQSQATLTQVQVEFQKAEKNYLRNKDLFEKKVISLAEYEIIEAAFQTAKAAHEGARMNAEAAQFNVESSEAVVRRAAEDLRKTTIFAPMSGIVTQLNVEKGERVLGTTQMTGTDMLHISDLNAIEARVDVSENDVLRVSLGDTAEIELDAYPDRKFKGVVSQVARSAKTNPLTGGAEQVTNFVVRIRLLASSYSDLIDSAANRFPFLPGMSASVDILTNKVTDVWSVPIQSVTTRADTASKKTGSSGKDEDENEVVFISVDGKAKSVAVKTGIQDDEYIQVLEGLTGEEEVISGPFSAISRTLENDSAIEITEEEEKPEETEE